MDTRGDAPGWVLDWWDDPGADTGTMYQGQEDNPRPNPITQVTPLAALAPPGWGPEGALHLEPSSALSQ